MALGVIGGAGPLAFTGGNCSIMGYDIDGNDVFWTVLLPETLHPHHAYALRDIA